MSKCEAISNTGAADDPSLDGFEQKTTDSTVLLGSPLSTSSALTKCLAARCADFARTTETHISPRHPGSSEELFERSEDAPHTPRRVWR